MSLIDVEHLQTTASSLAHAHGERWTAQRNVVVTVMAQAERHLTTDEVHARARRIDPSIGSATVYRTMSLLVTLGLVRQPPLGGSRAVYELAVQREHHDHLVDLDTREVIEFTNAMIEDLQHLVAKHLGFALVDHSLVLYGRRLSAAAT